MLSTAAVLWVVLLCALRHIFYSCFTTGYSISQVGSKQRKVMEHVPEVVQTQSSDVEVSFSHLHIYVDKVDDLSTYKSLEDRLNVYHALLNKNGASLSMEKKKQLWRSLDSSEDDTTHDDDDDSTFMPQNRDVIKQLLVGLGFRVTGFADLASTKTALVSSRDVSGVQIMVTAVKHADDDNRVKKSTLCDVFDSGAFSSIFDSARSPIA
jgi:hypothetical protein